MTDKSRKILFWSFFALFDVLALIIPLYSAGYRLDKNFNLTLTGGIFIVAPNSGIDIYLDGKLIEKTGIFKSVFVQSLEPKVHSILAAKEDYWPWTKKLEVKENLVNEARAMMLSKNISGKILLKGSFVGIKENLINKNILILEEKKQDKIAERFFNTKTSEFAVLERKEKQLSVSSLKTDHRDQIELILESNSHSKLFALSKIKPLPYFLPQEKSLIFETENVIKNFDFYPKRQDVAIIALKYGIFAAEFDRRGGQNFQPIYKGIDPNFAILENNLYVLDQGVLYEINL